ncbi:hypothetical protein EN41_23210 [Agrobacterium tumefaciens]|nr:hypothetical protein EN41_23210 [Agrobacterium tumefaciens]
MVCIRDQVLMEDGAQAAQVRLSSRAAQTSSECTMAGTAGTAWSFIVTAIVERSLRDSIIH